MTDPTETREATVGADPDADVPTHVATAATALAEALAAQAPPAPPETSFGEMESVLAVDDCCEGSSTEEYGIAPSAFSVTSEVSPPVESQDHVSGDVAEPEPVPFVTQGKQLPWRVMGSRRLWLRQETTRRRSRRATRGMVRAVPALGQVPRWCNLRISSGGRPSVWFRLASNVRRQQAAHCAFGRIVHVHRALRPRSPPLHQGTINGGMGQPRQSEIARSSSPSSTVI